MAILHITPVTSKLPQLRAALDGRFVQKIWSYTNNANGTIALQGYMDGTLRDIARMLEREGLITG